MRVTVIKRVNSVSLSSAGPQGPTGETGAVGATGPVAMTQAEKLVMWASVGAYTLTSATRDSDNVITTSTVSWPDGSSGTFTTVTKNSTFLTVDAYTITHNSSGSTATQSAVTRDALGNVTAQPAITIS